MGIVGAYALPHPPLAIPDVGRGQEEGIASTIAGYRAVAEHIAALEPETIVVISPHSIMYADYLHISPGMYAAGDMGRFGAPQVRVEKDYDVGLVRAIVERAQRGGIMAGTEGERDASLDHGVLVPLYFVDEKYRDYQLVRCGISGLPLLDHYRLGECIADAAEELGRRVAIIASGDLSHKLREEGPYGFDPAGPEYDERIEHVLATGDFGDLFDFGEALCDDAAECGHRSFVVMAGALDGRTVKASLLSHEGPFGVGYATAILEPGGDDSSRCFAHAYLEREQNRLAQMRENESPYVKIARLSLEGNILGTSQQELRRSIFDALISADPEVSDHLLKSRAGAFVSIHEHGRLRGCIGTIAPTQPTLADEIVENAVSASTRDPRFEPIAPDELPDLEINVDVLGESEAIDGLDELDPKRYGVIVTAGGRRGLLLPDLEGIDTPEEQVEIALRKAGIKPSEFFEMERFEVTRFH
ncbi:MAG: AmmeMemoRadiSam system protein A [Coriobacteriales bacterium]|jgi:AmmeMemoRadiSam system protein A